MITILQRFKYHYFPIYCVAVYFFFTNIHHKRNVLVISSSVNISTPLHTYSSSEIKSKEEKMLLDLKYKNMIHSYLLDRKSGSYCVDFEGKLIGHRTIYDEKFPSTLKSSTLKLNRKLLHSTLFGSIKIIKL